MSKRQEKADRLRAKCPKEMEEYKKEASKEMSNKQVISMFGIKPEGPKEKSRY